MLPASTAQAVAPGDDAQCPAAHPADQLTLGQQVTGLTTAGSYERGGIEHDSGVTPEPFTGTYRGTVEDDAGGDIYIFQLAGSRVTDADGKVDAGIWAGMSGSPVHAANGELIGAVAYSFSELEGSTFAGVTPAARMYSQLRAGAPVTAGKARIRLDQAEKKQLMREGLAPSAANSGLRRLAPVATLAGATNLSPHTRARLAKVFGTTAPRVVTGGSRTQTQNIPIVAGSNVAFAVSHGSVAAYAVGTATAVCGTKVLAFGHPAEGFPGEMTMHGAATVIVQENGGYSYKLTNLGAPVGTLTIDGLDGVTGTTGALPRSTKVAVSAKGQTTTNLTTNISAPDYAAQGTYVNVAVAISRSLDSLNTGGSATANWSIAYTRANGAKGVLRNTQRFSTRWELSDTVATTVADQVNSLVENGLEQIKLDAINVSVESRKVQTASRIGTAEYRAKKGWKRIRSEKSINAKPGKKLRIRVNTVPGVASTAAKKSKVFTFRMPKRPDSYYLSVEAANSGDEGDFEEGGSDAPATFAEHLKSLAVTPSDQITVTLTSESGKTRTKRWFTGSPTSGNASTSVTVGPKGPSVPEGLFKKIT